LGKNLKIALDRVLRKTAQKRFEAADRILHRVVISPAEKNLPALLTDFQRDTV
jgi:hypothetical protein